METGSNFGWAMRGRAKMREAGARGGARRRANNW